MTYVYYANRLWGVFPGGIPMTDWIEIPEGAFYHIESGLWAEKGRDTPVLEDEVPAETKLLHLLMTG